MGIRFFCPHCDRRLHVKDYLAGRRGICPHCDQPIVIPDAGDVQAAEGEGQVESMVSIEVRPEPESAVIDEPEVERVGPPPEARSGVTPVPAKLAEDDPLESAPHLHWCVRPVAGGQYGAKGAVFKTWLQEGRIAADDHVWQEGWDRWRLAGEVFPALAPGVAPPEPEAEATEPVSMAKRRGAGSASATKGARRQTTQLDATRERLLDYRLHRSRSQGREWVAILVLGVVCVALVVAFVWLMAQRAAGSKEKSDAARIQHTIASPEQLVAVMAMDRSEWL